MDSIETLFHRILGTRGVTESELSTTAERGRLSDLQSKLMAEMGRWSGSKLAKALDLSQRTQRHLQTYPETDAEARVWIEGALNLEREIKDMLPVDVWPAVFAVGAVSLFGFAMWRFFGRGYY